MSPDGPDFKEAHRRRNSGIAITVLFVVAMPTTRP
jgi:hypothetical protein